MFVILGDARMHSDNGQDWYDDCKGTVHIYCQ
jgi:hypothetical protein